MQDWQGRLLFAAGSAVITFFSSAGGLLLLAKKYGITREHLKKMREITGAEQTDRLTHSKEIGKLAISLKKAKVGNNDYKDLYQFVTGEPPTRPDQSPAEPVPTSPEPDPALIAAAAEQYVIATLMKDGGNTTVARVRDWQPNLTPDAILAAANRLTVKNFIQPVYNGVIRFAPAVDAVPQRTAELLRQCLSGLLVLEALETKWYRDHISTMLLGEISRIQMGLELSNDEQEECLKLIQWSPSALLYALTPDQLITRHRNDTPDLKLPIAGFDQNQFRRMLYFWFSHDFNHPMLGQYMYNIVKMTELKQVRYYQLKFEQTVLLEGRVTSRNIIGPADASIGGGYIHMLGWDESEQFKPGSP